MSKQLLKMSVISVLLSSHFLYSAPVNSVVATINVGVTPTGIAITPDSLTAYVANNNNYGISGADSVSVIDLTTNLVTQTITDDSFNQPYTITINPAGTFAYVTNSNSTTITVIDLTTNEVADVIDGFDGPSGMAITSDGLTGYVNNYGAGSPEPSGSGDTVRVVDLLTNTITGSAITVGQAPAGLAITSDDAFVYVINYVDGLDTHGTISVIQISDNTVVDTISGFSGPFTIAITPDDQYAYVANFGSNNFVPVGTTVSAVSLTSNTIVATIDLAIQPAGLSITPDGNFVYASNYNSLYNPYGVYDGDTLVGSVNILVPGQGTVNVIDIATNSLIAPTIPVGQSPANIAISASGEFGYVTNFGSNTVNVIALPTFEIVGQGYQIKNKYLTYTEAANIITWTVSGISLPVEYAIYSDAALTDVVGVVSASQPFVVRDRNVSAGKSYTYYIVGTNQAGTTSDPVIVTINPNQTIN